MADQLALHFDRCHHCGAPATLLCDGVLGIRRKWYAPPEPDSGKWLRDVGRWVVDTDRDDAVVTCDRPLCRDCATFGGATFMCGSGGCDHDTRDFCRDCRDPSGRTPLLSDEDIEALRRRRAMKEVGRG